MYEPQQASLAVWLGRGNMGVLLERSAASPTEEARLDSKGLQQVTPETAPGLTSWTDVGPLAFKVPGKSIGVTGGWRDGRMEGEISGLKYFRKEKCIKTDREG